MRAHVPIQSRRAQVESQEAYGGTRGHHLHLRHTDYEDVTPDRDTYKPTWWADLLLQDTEFGR